MLPNPALRRAIRALAHTLENPAANNAAGPRFHAWLAGHCQTYSELPTGPRSKTVAWSAAEEWPGSIEWYVIDDSIIGKPEYSDSCYRIPLADFESIPPVPESRRVSRSSRRARV